MANQFQVDYTSSNKTRLGQPLFWGVGCIFLAVAQLLWAGYQLGVGNQSIQIAFVQKLHDPGLYQRDVMVEQTLPRYPSYFYNGVAWLLNVAPLGPLYLGLQLLTAVGVMWGLVWLGRAMFGVGGAGEAGTAETKAGWPGWVGLVVILMMLAGHHLTLGGDGLYSTGFSHTWAAFAVGIVVLALFYGERYFYAFLLAGLMFNIHALEAAYLGAFMGAATLMSIRRLKVRRVVGWWLLYVLAAGPTVAVMFAMKQRFDDLWMMLMYVRSATHSFPSSWWEVGNPDVPRFALMIGMASAAMGLLPTVAGSAGHLRKTQWVAITAGLLFTAGYLLTEVWPSATMVRAQLFRCSRYVEVIALMYVAGGCVRAWMGAIGGAAAGLKPCGIGGKIGRWAEVVVMTGGVVCMGLPSMMPLLPWMVLGGGLVALMNGRLSWYAAVLVSGSLLVSLISHEMLHFVIPGWSEDFAWGMLADLRLPERMAMVAMAAGVMMWVVGGWWGNPGQGRRRPLLGLVMLGTGVTAAVMVVAGAWGAMGGAGAGADGDWTAAQEWASQNTGKNELFLTPPQMGGWRVHSQRAVVGEWRDGTQLYFSASFAVPWWDRMTGVQPGLLYNDKGTKMLARGKPMEQMDDEQLMALSKAFAADYVVLPAGKMRWMERVYANDRWEIYRPRIPVPTPGAEAMAAQRRFIDETVAGNIRRNRMSDARVQVVDAQGRPVVDAGYRVEQVRGGFHFGATMGAMKAMAGDWTAGMDRVPAAMNQTQLAAFKRLFNFSVTGITGTWLQIENQRGKQWFDDLDAYVDWCESNGVAVELHFVSGYEPQWVMRLRSEERAWERMRHARQMVERYGKRITYWQVIDDGVGENEAAMLFSMIRKQLPDAKLGIGTCVRFGSDAVPAMRERDMWRGLALIRDLKQKGVKVDFVSFHGHRPWGYWADAKLVYQTIDAFAKEGVRVHVSQLAVPDSGPIAGVVRQGQWNRQLQAEYYSDLLKVFFSSPSVDVINWEALGADTLTSGGGLLDENDQPTPAYRAIEQLISHDWRTQMSGKLGLDGAAKFKAFHGEYELALTLGGGQEVKTRFTVREGQDNGWRFVLDDGKQKLEAQR